MKRLLGVLILLVFSYAAFAQHEHHQPVPKKAATPAKKAPAKKTAPAKKPAAKTPVKKPAAKKPASKPVITKPVAQPVQQKNTVDHSQHHAPAAVEADTASEDHTGHIMTDDHSGHSMDTAAMHAAHSAHDMSSMSHAYSLNLPMNRNASGTGWLPDNSPMYGYMKHSGKWMFMAHGNVLLRYVNTDMFNKGSRGDSKIDVPNWFMAMGQRKVGQRGLFHFNTMFSLDALFAGGEGYPLLFQSGETWQGKPLIDRQHPHDLFSELSVSYAHAFSKKVDAFVYVGYPGEPALGSVAFMHRPSALPNPDAPISHHWNDATHITFGVATLGLRVGKFKLEGSSFTGREPDENRYDFDKPRFDSWSGRLSFNPSDNWSMHVGHGFVKEPEPIHPGEDVTRTTASVTYSKDLRGRLLNLTTLWGVNRTQHNDPEHAFLLEGAYAMNKLTLYTRYEWIQKSAEELGLDDTQFDHHALFPVNAITLGLNYDLLRFGVIRVAGGGHLSAYIANAQLDPIYGNNPMSGQVYLRFYPTLMN